MIPVQFNYKAPENLEAATKLLSEHQGAQVLAGGHSLIAAMKSGKISPPLLVDLKKIKSLEGIKQEEKSFLKVGAMTAYDKVANTSEVRKNYSALAEAANNIGDAQIFNWERIGNIFAYSDLACDVQAVALVLEANFKSVSTSVNHIIVADKFIPLGFQRQWKLNEIITSLDFPEPTPGSSSAYECIKHPASGYAVCGLAASITIQASNNIISKCRVAVTGATSYAIRLPQVETAMEGKIPTIENIAVAAQLAKENVLETSKTHEQLNILSDVYASAEYRTHLTGLLKKNEVK